MYSVLIWLFLGSIYIYLLYRLLTLFSLFRTPYRADSALCKGGDRSLRSGRPPVKSENCLRLAVQTGIPVGWIRRYFHLHLTGREWRETGNIPRKIRGATGLTHLGSGSTYIGFTLYGVLRTKYNVLTLKWVSIVFLKEIINGLCDLSEITVQRPNLDWLPYFIDSMLAQMPDSHMTEDLRSHRMIARNLRSGKLSFFFG